MGGSCSRIGSYPPSRVPQGGGTPQYISCIDWCFVLSALRICVLDFGIYIFI